MRLRGRPGQTLIEVSMATMVAAMTSTAVFSVMLSSFVSSAKADKRDAAAMAIKYAQQALQAYVSVDPTNPNMVNGIPGSPNNGLWPADSSHVWALRPNITHDISSLVAYDPYNPSDPSNILSPDPSHQASFTYTVQSQPCGGFPMGSPPDYPTACKAVTFRLSYTD